MIKKFKSIEELNQETAIDRQDHSPAAQRYPVRLILLNNFSSLNEIIRHLSEKGADIFQLNKLLPHNDGWLTTDDIINCIRLIDKDTVIVPFSEILRFKTITEFNIILTCLSETENSYSNYSKRIYIPLVGMKERIERDFLKTFHRKDNSAPIWYLEDPPNPKIKIFQIAFESGFFCNFKIINNTSDWLEIWKENNPDIIICKSKSIAYLYKDFFPDMIFSPEEIIDLKKYLETVVGVKIPIEYKKSDIPFWQRLTDDINQKNNESFLLTFENYIHQHFNINKFSILSKDNLLKQWFQHKEKYSRWLLAQWISNQDNLKESYIFNIMSGLKFYSDDELTERIWFKIFDMIPSLKSFSEERKSYLNIIHSEYKIPFHQIEANLQNKIESIAGESAEIQASYLTSISFAERKYLTELFKEKSETEQNKIKGIIRTIYPELFYYLEWNNEGSDNWITEYFKEYNLSKVLNRKSDKLSIILNEKNKDADSFYKWYYETENNQEVTDAHVLWIDGLGAEWISLIEYLINADGKEKNKVVEKQYIKKVNLPSITECNRFDNTNHISELDEYIHNENPYKYPDDLIKQIELIKQLIKKEVIESNYDKIAIVSDHGFTFLAQKRFGNYKKFGFAESEHEGRYMWREQDYQNDSEFILHQTYSGDCKGKKALIALKHTSLYNTPFREVHGGATPEEVLVPCFIVSKIDDTVIYEAKLLTNEITMKNPLIIFSVTPQPSIPPVLSFKGDIIELEQNDNKWCAYLKGFKPGNYKFELNVHNQKIERDVNIKGGIKEKELF